MARSGNLKQKDEFRNVGDGWVGVVTIDGRGDHYGTPVAPGDSVWLSEAEQIATANAPRNDADNPFANGSLQLLTTGAEVRNRRPYGRHAGGPVTPEVTTDAGGAVTVEIPEETGVTPEPQDDPELGRSAPGEEVATPKAVKRRRVAA